MGEREIRFLNKNKIDVKKIMYMTRDGRKTVIHSEDGSTLDTFHTIKGILEDYPKNMFEIINKGVVVSSAYVDSVDGNIYTMKDGTKFKGRIRASRQQKINAEKYNDELNVNNWNSYQILDNMPIAFCVIELVFDEKGHGMDFIFRYCNKEMEQLEGKTIDEMMDRSFYQVFENGDKKWLVTYADVAINGATKVIESYSPEINSNLRIYCYQPKPNFCACTLIKL